MIYIHIPYCRSFCTYCGFYSEIPTAGFAAFTDAICGEIEARAGEIPWENNTLYIGGGTPSVLPLGDLQRIVAALAATQDYDEFTVEVNPDDIVRLGDGYIAGLRELGVNRVSMGVQSLDDRVLRWMNRRHDAAAARRAYRMLRDGGIDNISIDLIFGFGDLLGGRRGEYGGAAGRPPGDAAEALWKRTIEEALDIAGDGTLPKHISAYQLSVESDSTLAEMVENGRYIEPPDDFCARQYDILCGALAAAGYHHYEISNFALPGFEARHNSAYWRHVPYIGFGPAAHSFLGIAPAEENSDIDSTARQKMQHVRRWNRPDICAYLRAAKTGDWASITGSEVLSDDQIRTEKIMLALRTDTGIARESLDHSAAHLADPTSVNTVDQLLASGALVAVGDRLRIPEDHFFVSDDIISRLI